jgi:hypothetical protein
MSFETKIEQAKEFCKKIKEPQTKKVVERIISRAKTEDDLHSLSNIVTQSAVEGFEELVQPEQKPLKKKSLEELAAKKVEVEEYNKKVDKIKKDNAKMEGKKNG